MSENNDTSNESNSVGSDTLMMYAYRVPAGGANSLLRASVLRPSVLGSSMFAGGATGFGNSSNSNSVATTESGANYEKTAEEMSKNPFMKDQKDDEKDADEANCEKNETGGDDGSKTEEKDIEPGASGEQKEEEQENDVIPDPLKTLHKNGLERANLFAAAKSSIPRVEKSGFVFGQNVHERVIVDNLNPEGTKATTNSDNGSDSGELLFSSVIQNAAKTSDSENASAGAAAGLGNKEVESRSLNDVAREYEESRAQKRKFEEVQTFTGEENEVNILDISCKLFAFVDRNYEERGRGSLRLNDPKDGQGCSRVVFRTSGNLRLLINTKVWAGMIADRPSPKSLRITAMDHSGTPGIFLIMARPLEINQLDKAISERIELRKRTHPEELNATNNVANTDNAVGDVENGNASVAAAIAQQNDLKDDVETCVPEALEEPSPKKALVEGNATAN